MAKETTDLLANVSLLLGIVATVWAGILVVYKFYKSRIKPFTAKVDRVLTEWPVFYDRHCKLEVEVKTIKAKILPNGGSSLDDKLNVIINTQELMREKQKALMYSDLTPMFTLDANENLTFVNAAWLKLTGFNNPEDAYGIGWLRAIPEDERKKLMDIREQQRQSPFAFYDTVIFKNIMTGELVKTTCKTTLVKDAKGQVIEKIGSLQVE